MTRDVILLLDQDFCSHPLRNKYLTLTASIVKYFHTQPSVNKYLPIEFHNDFEAVMRVCKKNARLYQQVSEELKRNTKLVTLVVNLEPNILYSIPHDIENIREVVHMAVKREGLDLSFAPSELKNDREIVKEAIENNPFAYRYISAELKKDRNLAKLAVSKNCNVLSCLTKELQTDPIILQTIKEAEKDTKEEERKIVLDKFRNANEEEQKSMLMEVLNCGGGSYIVEAIQHLTNDREIMLSLVRQRGELLIWASDELKRDRELVWEAIKKEGTAICFACEELKKDRDLILKAVGMDNESVLVECSEELLSDREFLLNCIRLNGNSLHMIDQRYQWMDMDLDMEFVLESVKLHGSYLSKSFSADLLKVRLDFAYPELSIQQVETYWRQSL